MNRGQPRKHTIRGEAQSRAIANPLRLEIIGQFIAGRPLSIREIAERMGRPPSAIHYHVRLLEKSGLLKRAGVHREGRRREAKYRLVAEMFEVEGRGGGDTPDNKIARKTMASAFRMAERDLKAALEGKAARSSGSDRNLFATRIHCRLSRKDLARVNRQIDALFKTLAQVHQRHTPGDEDEFVSLTLALLPLPDRSVNS